MEVSLVPVQLVSLEMAERVDLVVQVCIVITTYKPFLNLPIGHLHACTYYIFAATVIYI